MTVAAAAHPAQHTTHHARHCCLAAACLKTRPSPTCNPRLPAHNVNAPPLPHASCRAPNTASALCHPPPTTTTTPACRAAQAAAAALAPPASVQLPHMPMPPPVSAPGFGSPRDFARSFIFSFIPTTLLPCASCIATVMRRDSSCTHSVAARCTRRE